MSCQKSTNAKKARPQEVCQSVRALKGAEHGSLGHLIKGIQQQQLDIAKLRQQIEQRFKHGPSTAQPKPQITKATLDSLKQLSTEVSQQVHPSSNKKAQEFLANPYSPKDGAMTETTPSFYKHTSAKELAVRSMTRGVCNSGDDDAGVFDDFGDPTTQ